MTEIASLRPPRAGTAQRVLVAAALAATAIALGLVCTRYLAFPGYVNHLDGNIAISAWDLVRHGAPIYELQDGAPRFANLYGPLAYLAELPAMLLFGPSVLASKATSVAALAAAVAVLAAHCLREPRAASLDPLLYLIAGLLAFAPWSFFVHGDPIELLLVAVAVAASTRPIVVGICIGLATAVKIDAPLYFLPIVFELYRRRGWRPLLLSLSAGAATLWPFLLPGVSAHDYAVTLGQQLAGRRHTLSEAPKLLVYFAMLALPVALPLAVGSRPLAQRAYGLAGLASLVLLLYPATFPGAGPHHFLPLLPILAEARRRLAADGTASPVALLPALAIAGMIGYSTVSWMEERSDWGALAVEAVGLALDGPGGPAQIGYGDTAPSYEIAQLARARLAFRGVPPLIDGQILMELRESGIDGSRRWVPYVSDCRNLRWVLPKGERPFALGSYYRGVVPFDDSFRRAFAAHYRPVAASAHFTLWGCGEGSAAAGGGGSGR